jgi:RNA-directed DNA polymerase
MIRLIGKWLKAGTLEDGALVASEGGTPQGAVISPLLANIYLHYVFDLWAHQWRRRHARGNVVIVRYADDIVVGADKQSDARRFVRAMQARLEKFSLALHPDKTRVLEFGRFAAVNRAKRGLGKPQTFDFLGFTHISGCDRRGKFLLRRITRRDRAIAALKRIKEELRRRWHQSIPEQGRWLRQVVQGYMTYHAVPGNYPAMKAFRGHVVYLWCRALRRRGQRDRTTWRRVYHLAAAWLPRARILHPWPTQRFDATQGKSPVRESRTPGSVRGALGNGRPYRDYDWKSRPGAGFRKIGERDRPAAASLSGGRSTTTSSRTTQPGSGGIK